jgi:multicomponent Na+:H+ antiporter subunit D
MNNNLLLLPLLSPFFAAIFCLFFWKKFIIQKGIVLLAILIMNIGAFYLLAEVWEQGVQILQAANWKAPFGIVLVADLFSTIMICVTGVVAAVVFIYSFATIDNPRVHYGFFPILLFLIFGITGAFLAGDIFNLYVWFEIILVSTFVILTLGGTRPQLEGAVKYVVINYLASALFLAGIGIVYGLTGTLNMADLAIKIKETAQPDLITLSAIFFLVAFGIKAAVFPLFFWLPPSYHTPPIAVTALISGLLTKVGAYSLIRFFTLIYTHQVDFTHNILLIIAAFTLVIGVGGAIIQNDMRKILTFSIISQIGYMILGLGFYTPLALAGVILFLIHNILVKTNLLLLSGVIRKIGGSYLLRDTGGIYNNHPIIATLFLISGFALTGLPPLSGFWGKFMLIQAGLQIEEYALIFITLGASVASLIYIAKIWNEAFWKDHPQEELEIVSQLTFWKSNPLMLGPIVLITIIILIIGIYPEPFYNISTVAGQHLFNPEAYIKAVLQL